MNGKIILKKQEFNVKTGNQLFINKESLTTGIYILQVKTNKNLETTKLIVQ